MWITAIFLSLSLEGISTVTVALPLLKSEMILSPDLITRRITYPFVPAAFFCTSVGLVTFTTSSVIVAPFASEATVVKASRSRLTCPFSVLTVREADVSNTTDFTVAVSS